MKFIVIEGVDGSGKSTQIKLFMKYLENKNIPFRYIHFPRTESPVYGELIARFLRGDFGNLETVDPYLVALLYAGDRKDAGDLIRSWINEGYMVLLDRYVYSNIAFQCAKIRETVAQEVLRKWILNLEFEYNRIPKPDINLLLDVPFSFTEKKLKGIRKGDERAYLNGLKDIHEEDLEFQKRVRTMYLRQVNTSKDFIKINCVDENDEMLTPETIHDLILKEINL